MDRPGAMRDWRLKESGAWRGGRLNGGSCLVEPMPGMAGGLGCNNSCELPGELSGCFHHLGIVSEVSAWILGSSPSMTDFHCYIAPDAWARVRVVGPADLGRLGGGRQGYRIWTTGFSGARSHLGICDCPGGGGEGGIRTHGGCDTTPVFETDALSRSATSPPGRVYRGFAGEPQRFSGCRGMHVRRPLWLFSGAMCGGVLGLDPRERGVSRWLCARRELRCSDTA